MLLKNKRKKKRCQKKKVFPKRNKFLRLATKIHFGTTILVLLFYLSIGIFGGSEYILRDAQDKYKVLGAATSLTVRLIAPPGKPSVTATPSCSGTNALVFLDWTPTSDTDNYDVYRDGILLISSITDDYYQDNYVQSETSYIYYVIANGPNGNTQSDDVSATTGKCSSTPTCQITSINGKPFTGISKTTDRTPSFSGTTNIPNADIQIGIYSGPVIVANTTANLNGYWSWTVPSQLDRKTQTIYVTATDPLDPTRFVQISGQFVVQKEEEEEKEKKKTEETATVPVSSTPTPIPTSPSPEITPSQNPETISLPFEFKISVSNPKKIAYSGNDLEFNFEIKKSDLSVQNTDVSFSIVDSGENAIKSWTEKIYTPEKIQSFEKSAALQKLMKNGRYKIIASAKVGDTTISAEDSFEVKEKPILNLGGGFIVTYSSLLSYVGWILLTFFAILILMLILLIVEHHLSTQALFHITEDYLKKKGVISQGKEVSK